MQTTILPLHVTVHRTHGSCHRHLHNGFFLEEVKKLYNNYFERTTLRLMPYYYQVCFDVCGGVYVLNYSLYIITGRIPEYKNSDLPFYQVPQKELFRRNM